LFQVAAQNQPQKAKDAAAQQGAIYTRIWTARIGMDELLEREKVKRIAVFATPSGRPASLWSGAMQTRAVRGDQINTIRR